ncbi:efflux RND transporter periplasmic adaptor subunit [Phenylobacterium sp.]|uniref:efflux RND transporter periplasmic adaptor subunit n=1 Tax=Phenylobacterium sp. TaxID=1871053 RepID=UPI002737481F|nr:efflux RND transporter periplasmic adaptor subunit [Phenylobacterium sp.]MDP3853479.1 efflux RND transporter periplasmic adaptor subunit [Phenylobacterium sp.]
MSPSPTGSAPIRAARRLPRAAWIALAVVALVALALVGWQVMKPKAPKDPYRTAAVETGSITKSVSASGTLEALVTVDVGSQISGQITRVMVDFNDEVKRGQVLALLDPQTYESRVAQSQADVTAGQAALRQAQAGLAGAQADYNRKRTLVNQGIYAPSVLDTSQAAFLQARAGVDSARARIAQSQAAMRVQRVDLGRTTIVAPIDGVIVDRQIEPGQTVAASLQAPILFRIAQDLSKVEVKISVDEADIGQVQEGQAVKFTVDAFPDDNFTGIVTQVRKQPVTEQNVVAYIVMAEADNPQGKLLPGMTANADIVLQQKANVLKVPAAALRWTPASENGQTVRAPGFGPPGMGGGGGGQRQQGGGRQGGGMGGQRVVAQLDLDAAQQKTWAAIQADLRQKSAAAFASAGGDRSAMRETMRKNMTEALAKLEPTLKPDQKTKLAALRATMGQAGRGDRSGFAGGVVYVLRDDKPVPIPVRVGATDGSFTEIRGALKAGDQVITGGGPKAKIKAASPMGGPGGGGGVRVRM